MLPLEGIRVVALEQAVAGPFCTRNLADLGADVIKVERPGSGDLARGYDSVVLGQSAYFVWLNRGKRSIALDLARPEDRATLDSLLDRADVFVHNLGPGAIERLGLGWDSAHARWPRLVWCAISGYGPEGPYAERKAYDMLVQAESGVMAVTGEAERPVKVGVSLADLGGGLYACASILAALRLRDHDEAGRRIDVALFDCLAEWMMPPLYHQMYGGDTAERAGARHTMIVPYGAYRCADGDVMLGVQNEPQWERLCTVVLRRPELARDPRFAGNELRLRARATLEPMIEAVFMRETRGEIESRLADADVPFGSLNTVRDVAQHPQLRARWRDVPTPGGIARTLVPPFNIAGAEPQMRAVPRLDEHGDAIRAELA